MTLLKLLWNYFFAKKKIVIGKIISEPELMKEAEIIVESKPIVQEVSPVDVSKQNNLIPERFEGESFEEYRKRRKLAELFLKKKQKGEMVHLSQKILYDKTGRNKKLLFEKGKTFTRTKSK